MLLYMVWGCTIWLERKERNSIIWALPRYLAFLDMYNIGPESNTVTFVGPDDILHADDLLCLS